MLRRLIFFSVLFLAGVVAQFAWLRYFAPYGIAPNLILPLVVYIGLTRGSFSGQLMGFAWGIAWDALSTGIFGCNALILACIGYTAGFLSHKLNESKTAGQMLLVGLASLFSIVASWILYQIFAPGTMSYAINYITLFQPVYNMVMTPIIFWVTTTLADYFLTTDIDRY